MKTYTVLIIEDREKDYIRIKERIEYVSRMLHEDNIHLDVNGIKCWEHEHDELLELYRQKIVDIIILDYELEWGKDQFSYNGIMVLQKIANNSTSKLPFIIYASGRFGNDLNASLGITDSDSGSRFYHHPMHKTKLWSQDNDTEMRRFFVDNIIPVLEPRIVLNLTDYPFNTSTYCTEGDYTISMLRSTESIQRKEKKPCHFNEQELILNRHIIALLFKKQERFGIIHVRGKEIVLSMMKFEFSKTEPSLNAIREYFGEHGIQLIKRTSILYNPKNIRHANREYSILSNSSDIDYSMIDDFKRKINRESYPATKFVPFYTLFRKFS